MMDVFSTILAIAIILLSGICYRIRGSEAFSTWPLHTLTLFKPSIQLNGWRLPTVTFTKITLAFRGDRIGKQLIGGLPRGLGVWLFAEWPYALAAWLLSALADTAGHAQGQSFGSPGDDDPKQAEKMFDAGIISIAPVLATLLAAVVFSDVHVGYLAFILATVGGALEPVAYYLGWRMPSIGTSVEATPWYRRLLTGTEWGELFTGFLLGLFVLGAP